MDTRLTHRNKPPASVSALPLCAVCDSGCALSRATSTPTLDSARLRHFSCTAGRLRQKQALAPLLQAQSRHNSRYEMLVTLFRPMIHLHLTLEEMTLIRQALSQSSPTPSPTLQQQQLLDKLAAAHQQAIRQRVCPICNQAFTQLKVGRIANYCSLACKQKAYRQRRKRARRQFGPRRPDR